MYQWVMVAVLCEGTSISVWTYWMPCTLYSNEPPAVSVYVREPIFAVLSGRERLTIGLCLNILEDVLSYGSSTRHPRYRFWRGKKTIRP